MAASQRPAAAILAGGLARRMGGLFKAALDLGGVPIIARQLDLLRQVADPVFVVGGNRQMLEPYGVEVVEDALPGRGPLGGIYTALSASPRARTFIVACDMPFLRLELLRHLAAIEADVVIPRTERGREPLCALYAQACAGPIRRRLARGLREARHLPEELSVMEIGPETLRAMDPHGLLFVNLNTPHDYERARQLFGAEARGDRIMDAPDAGG